MGEFELIELLADILGPPTITSRDSHGLLIAIGDDAALWRAPESVEILTTDTMIEGVHFRLNTTPWRDLGWKALAINLSDIAAMGGAPLYAIVSLGLNPDTEVESVADMYRGMADIAGEYRCSIVGGDTVSAPCTMITVSLTGHASCDRAYPENVLTRSRAQAGQRIAVTGYLGGSGAGFKMLSEGLAFDDDSADYMERAHNHPTPRVAEGQLLLRQGVRAAMDLSDGLMADLPKMCKASGVAAKINSHRVPIHPKVRRAFGEQALELALSGGEDYELLFTGDERVIERVNKECPTPVTVIGEVIEGEPGTVTLLDESGTEVEWTAKGWEHFTPAGKPRTSFSESRKANHQ